jgi:hypothetical protein
VTWNAPLTWTLNQTVTAAQLNAQIRDNLLETAPAKATTAGSHFAVTGTNGIAERRCQTATVATSQTTTSTSYVDLATAGPSVTATTGVLAFTWAICQMSNNTTLVNTFFSVNVSGATADGASDARAAIWGAAADQPLRYTTTTLHSLTAGSNTFKIMYKVNSNTGTYSRRDLAVMPL